MPAESAPCFSCGAMVPDIDGPTHRYMSSSPGCWAIYGEVLALEYSDVVYFRNHRLTVDAYAVQHPGEPSRATIRSVCLHLCTLFAVLERDVPPQAATALLQRLAARGDFQWLDPPPSVGELTVVHAHGASGAQEHLRAVEEWAGSAWAAWSRHHDTIRRWVEPHL